MEWINDRNLFRDKQLAYQRGFSGTDHLFLLNILKEDVLAMGKTLYVGFIDLQKSIPECEQTKPH
jgi:hypothetical protein